MELNLVQLTKKSVSDQKTDDFSSPASMNKHIAAYNLFQVTQ